MGRLEKLTKEVQSHDRELMARRMDHGKIGIFRKSNRYEHYDVDGVHLVYSRSAPFFIFALTHNWSVNGEPVDWGIEPIMARLKAIDLWNRKSFADDMIKSYEKDQESVDKDRDNSIESFLLDFRRQFSKTFSEFNVSSMKTDNRRKKDGNSKQNSGRF